MFHILDDDPSAKSLVVNLIVQPISNSPCLKVNVCIDL